MNVVAAPAPRQASAAPDRRILKRACRGRADGDDPSSLLSRTHDRFGCLDGNLVVFRIDDVIFDAFDSDRLERPIADVECDLGSLDAGALELRTGPA